MRQFELEEGMLLSKLKKGERGRERGREKEERGKQRGNKADKAASVLEAVAGDRASKGQPVQDA